MRVIERQQPQALFAVLLSIAALSCGTTSPASDDARETSIGVRTAESSSLDTAVAPNGTAFDHEQFEAQVAFWSTLAVPSALEANLHHTLADMTLDSTAVVFGTVVGRVEGPLVDEDAPDGVAFRLGASEVRVDEVVAGSLPVDDETILVTSLRRPESDRSPTDGRTLMFLIWGGRAYEEGWAAPNSPPEMEDWNRSTYHIISSQGLYIEGPEGAWNPIAAAQEGYRSDDPTKLVDPVAEEARQYTLDEVADLARSILGNQ